MSGARIAPGGLRDVGVVGWAAARIGGRVAGTEPPKLFLTLGRHRALLRGWLRFAGRLMPRGRLPRRDTELVILRVAHLRGCAYEFDHHVRLSRRAGVTAADIARIRKPVLGPEWSARERTLLAAVDMVHVEQDLDDATWAALRRELDEPEAIEFCLLVAHYEMLATVIGTLRIEPDRARR